MPQPLTINEIRTLLEKQQNRAKVARASAHESRLRLHSSFSLDGADATAAGTAITQFLNWWEGVLSKPEKFNLFTMLMTFPLPTVALNAKIFNTLEKVFDGRNPVQQYDFRVPEVAGEWSDYREEIGLTSFFRRTVFDTLAEGRVNSLVVVDLPETQTGDMPTPYPYLLNVENVLDYGWNGSTFDWITWRIAEDQLAFFDSYHYRVLQVERKGGIDVKSIVSEVPHDLGYTPVRWMWTDPVGNDCTDLKESPVSKYLGKMDWLLAYQISKQVNELVAQYPIYWGYSASCDYIQEHPERGVIEQCKKGVLIDGIGNYMLDHRTRGIRRCPVCANRRLLGAGSMVTKPYPSDPEMKDVGNPVGVVPAEAVSLEYNQKEVDRLISDIFTGITGAENEAVNNKAVNEKQVGAIVDAKTQILRNLKANFEQVQKWTEETIIKLRYGGDMLKGITINLGTEFHLYTADDILQQYQTNRANGADSATLDRLWDDYLSARYRNDPLLMERQRILTNLDPFRHKTPMDVKELGIVPPELVYLKFNLSTLVLRFEREQTNIVDFGSALNFDRKIESIQQILISYAKEITDTGTGNGEPNREPGRTTSASEGEDGDASEV